MGKCVGRTANCTGKNLKNNDLGKIMKTYHDVTNFIGDKVPQLSLAEQINFVQKLIYQFVKDLPNDWVDGELDSEKPFYKTIFDEIINQSWQDDVIEQQLSDLDNLMWDMGEDYPHSTSEAILLLMELLDNWLVLSEFEQKSEDSDNMTLQSAVSFLNYFDLLVDEETGELADNDDWLQYSQTKQGFDLLKSALNS